jgi:membrane protease YdiL (CAAX protease family)
MRKQISPALIVLQGVFFLFLALACLGIRDALFKQAGQPGAVDQFQRQIGFSLGYAALGVVLGVVCVFFFTHVYERIMPLPEGEESEFQGYSTFGMLVVAASSGFSEEVFFRGAIQPMLGVWWTSVLFGLGHWTSWQRSLETFFVSLALGVALQYSDNLWLPIMVHATNNFVGLYMRRE